MLLTFSSVLAHSSTRLNPSGSLKSISIWYHKAYFAHNTMDSAFNVNDVMSQRPIFVGCVGALLLMFGLNYALNEPQNIIGLVPVNTLINNTYVWNLVTSSFYEVSVVKLVFDIVALWVATKPTDSALSLEQFGLYFGFSILACALGTSAYGFVKYFTTTVDQAVVASYFGFNGVLMTLLMFIRHQRRSELVHEKIPILNYHHLPALLVVSQSLLALVGVTFLCRDLPFTIIAFFISWSYLRFQYRYNENEPLGDKSEDFSFVAMFPEVLHIVLIPFSTAFYNIFAVVGLFPVLEVAEKKTFHHLRHTIENVSPAGAEEAPPAAKQDLVAERRRAKALKLLDAKMAELQQEPESWDEHVSPPPVQDDIEALGARNLPELSKLKI